VAAGLKNAALFEDTVQHRVNIAHNIPEEKRALAASVHFCKLDHPFHRPPAKASEESPCGVKLVFGASMLICIPC
jgi:hypothetical protein